MSTITIEEFKIIMEVLSNTTCLIIFTIVGIWAVISHIKMDNKVKQEIIEEKKRKWTMNS